MDRLGGGLLAKVARGVGGHQVGEVLHALSQGLEQDHWWCVVVQHDRWCCTLVALPVGLTGDKRVGVAGFPFLF